MMSSWRAVSPAGLDRVCGSGLRGSARAPRLSQLESYLVRRWPGAQAVEQRQRRSIGTGSPELASSRACSYASPTSAQAAAAACQGPSSPTTHGSADSLTRCVTRNPSRLAYRLRNFPFGIAVDAADATTYIGDRVAHSVTRIKLPPEVEFTRFS
jgi:hypothetical protein